MSGATSRNKGNRWECHVANYLASRLSIDIRTSRSMSGGVQGGADIVTVEPDGTVIPTVEGWSVECKNSANGHRPTDWLRQAKRQADSGLYAVVAKNPRRPVEDATVYVPAAGVWWWLGDGLAAFDGTVDVRWLSFGLWADLLTFDVDVARE